LHWFLLRSVGDDDAAGRLHVFFNPAHDHTIMQRTELHGLYLTLSKASFLYVDSACNWRRTRANNAARTAGVS
jgi:hypothetical protein